MNWKPELKLARPEITEGFTMAGFTGLYYMWPEEYELLAKYVDLTAGNYVEVGSMCGVIAASLAAKYPQRNFYCVDNFSEGHATIAGNRQAFQENARGRSNVILIEEDSRTALLKLPASKFGIAFIDANHAYDYVMNDAISCWRLVQPGGVLAFHDYGCVPETTQAVHDFSFAYSAPMIESASSLMVLRKAG